MTKEKKSKNRDTDQQSRQFGVILEDMDGKLDTLLEGQQGLAVRTDKIEVGFEEFEGKFDGLESKFGGLAGKFDGLEGKFDSFQEETRSNFRSVFDYLSRIDDELKFIRREIEDLRKTLTAKADLERLETLERRVQKIEEVLVKSRKN
ncbi:MAG: hypothetical protein HY093_04930 [Candidatus Liptonbacteria bacterium]|nr:hypothetical protein [Candidatus Liptonbacteria bacterium]